MCTVIYSVILYYKLTSEKNASPGKMYVVDDRGIILFTRV